MFGVHGVLMHKLEKETPASNPSIFNRNLYVLTEIYSSKDFRASAIPRAIAGAIVELELGPPLLFLGGEAYFAASTPRKLAFPIENGLFLSEIHNSEFFEPML